MFTRIAMHQFTKNVKKHAALLLNLLSLLPKGRIKWGGPPKVAMSEGAVAPDLRQSALETVILGKGDI
jgi:hypothetical protein